VVAEVDERWDERTDGPPLAWGHDDDVPSTPPVSADDAAPPKRHRQRDPSAKWWQADTRTRTVAIEAGFLAHPSRYDERAAPDLDLGVGEAISWVLAAESPRHRMQHSHPDFDRSPIATA
jgi:hypothetical protein